MREFPIEPNAIRETHWIFSGTILPYRIGFFAIVPIVTHEKILAGGNIRFIVGRWKIVSIQRPVATFAGTSSRAEGSIHLKTGQTSDSREFLCLESGPLPSY
jgi:hypothetical protein